MIALIARATAGEERAMAQGFLLCFLAVMVLVGVVCIAVVSINDRRKDNGESSLSNLIDAAERRIRKEMNR